MSGRTTATTNARTNLRPPKVTSQTPTTRLRQRERDDRYIWPQMRQRDEDWRARFDTAPQPARRRRARRT